MDAHWIKTRDFNMRTIENDFLDGADIRQVCDWAIGVGKAMDDEDFVTRANMLKEGCQALIDKGQLQPYATAKHKPLSPEEIRQLRDRYR